MPQGLRLRSAGARAEEERKNFTDYFSRILASLCGIGVLSEEKLIFGQSGSRAEPGPGWLCGPGIIPFFTSGPEQCMLLYGAFLRGR
jgi:hypothetical protein